MLKKKERLKPVSLYPHDPGKVIAALLKVDPEKVREKEKERDGERKEK